MLGLLLASLLSHSPAPARPERVLVVSMDANASALQPAFEKRLAAQGMAVVPRESVVAKLLAGVRTTAEFQAAAKLQTEGLTAEQNLDLATARAKLEAARGAFAKQKLPLMDPKAYGDLLAELARVDDEQGDPAAMASVLRERAGLPVPPLDERAFSPELVKAEARARATESPRTTPLPLSWAWRSGLVDEVLALQSGGDTGGEALVLLLYRRGEAVPGRSAALGESEGAQPAAIDQALKNLAAPEAPPDSAVPADASALVLGASLVFPAFYGYVNSGADLGGVGLAVLGRVERGNGPAFGGRLDFLWQNVQTEQATFTARWTTLRGRWRFSVEPGLGLKLRQGVPPDDPPDDDNSTRTAFSLVAEVGGSIGLVLGRAVIEEDLTVGVEALSSDYSANLPVALRTSVEFRF